MVTNLCGTAKPMQECVMYAGSASESLLVISEKCRLVAEVRDVKYEW